MIKVRIAARARADLRDIRIYSKVAFGPRVAKAYLLGLNQVFASLRSQPSIGRLESDLGEGVRGLGFRSHRVYDRVNDEEIVIVRILHQARDVASAWSRSR